MKVITHTGFWSVEDVRKHHDYLWVYGDNDIKRGKGGQAVIRDEPNTIGIPTKKMPYYIDKAFYTDDEYKDNCNKITIAIDKIRATCTQYKAIVLPEDGIGTGLAQLPARAPKTYQFLTTQINKLVFDLTFSNTLQNDRQTTKGI